MKKQVSFLCAALMMGMSMAYFSGCNDNNRIAADMAVDFAARNGQVVQNLKKVDMFCPNWYFLGEERTQSLDGASLETLQDIGQMHSDNLRFDMMFQQNGIGNAIGHDRNSDGSSELEWKLVDRFLDKVAEQDIAPFIIMVGTPLYAAQEENGTLKEGYGVTPDLERYYTFCYNVAKHLKDRGQYTLLETWNEPDLGNVYWYDSMYDNMRTVATANRAYHDANPFATVYTPGLAYIDRFINEKQSADDGLKSNWQRLWEQTLDPATGGGVMPEGISWHFYTDGNGGMNDVKVEKGWDERLQIVREAIKSYSDGSAPEFKEDGLLKENGGLDLRKLQQHVSEFNSVGNGSGWNSMRLVWSFFDGIAAANAATDVTRVAWSQYIAGDTHSMIKEYSYEIMPSYHTLWMYGRLPVDAVSVQNDNEMLGVMAGADSHRAGVILYNRSDMKEQNLDVTFTNLPAGTKSCDVYVIDQDDYDNGIYTKTPVLYRHIDEIKDGMKLELDVPETGALYVEFNTEFNGNELDEKANVGKLLKKEYYYADRGDNMAYTDIHNNSLTAYAGMVNHATGESGVAVILGDMKKHETLSFSYEVWGGATASQNASLGVRVDYHTVDGFVKSVWLPIDGFEKGLIAPFGTEKAADKILSLGGGNKGTYSFALAENAPEAWDGIVEISYLIKDAGVGATAKFTVR